jgi:hypothetical protein
MASEELRRCELCSRSGLHDYLCFESKSYYTELQSTNRWFDFFDIACFGALVAHETHKRSISYFPVKFPQEEVTIANKGSTTPGYVKQIVSPAFRNSTTCGTITFSVIHVYPQEKQVKVYCAKGTPLSHWENHTKYILQCWCGVGDPSHLTEWTVDHHQACFVEDGSSCGAHMCMALLDAFLPRTVDLSGSDGDACRSIVIKKMLELLEKYE